MAQINNIIANPLTNKDTAFSYEERKARGLIGRLPVAVETLEEQAARAYRQFTHYGTNLDKYVYLDQLHSRNEVLYYKLLVEHFTEMLPIVYNPTVGEAIKLWSREYRRSRAVYLDINHPEDIRESLQSLGLGAEDVDLLVVSDSEAILGIGDWGVNGTDIAVGKLAVYSAAAGIHPQRTIAVNLDVGTDNALLLYDPSYLGNRHARVRGQRYDEFVAEYLRVASELFPHALLHFEDFAASTARRILVANREKYLIFNDDMQGTAAIVLSAIISALKVTGQDFTEQRLVVYGAGTAGSGMADQISNAMERAGLSREEARRRVWLIDVNGLVTDDMSNIPDYQIDYARPAKEVAKWMRKEGKIGLLEVVRQVKPTILIGTSADHGAFSETVVKTLCQGVERPILLPLSNPTERIEVMPADAIRWSEGRALVATGIPADPVDYEGVRYYIGQGNNALLFPGLGLGVVVSGARLVTDGMLIAAAEAVTRQVNVQERGAAILPPVDNLRATSASVAIAVAKQAVKEGVATLNSDNWVQTVLDRMWYPRY